MADTLRIPVEQLRGAVAALLDHLEAVTGEVVEVPDTAFWVIPPEARHDVYEQPRGFTIGQLGESWEHVLSTSETDEDVLSYGLVWLADVLREIGEHTVQ